MELLKIYQTIDSTNREAARLLGSGQAFHGMAILSLNQTEGRGQYGRSWHSSPGEHLAMSIILQPKNMLASDLPLLSMKASLAVVRALKTLIPDFHPRIKWPNDIYAGNKKIAGILVENSLNGANVSHSIIGIGLNVNEDTFPDDIPNPTSLFILFHKKTDLEKIALQIRDQMMIILEEDVENWKQEYDNLIYGLGEECSFAFDGSNIHAKVLGVNEDGKLILQNDQGTKSYFGHEIKWQVE